MDKIFGKLHRLANQLPPAKGLSEVISHPKVLSGVVFVLLQGSNEQLDKDLPQAVAVAGKYGARYIGMTSGLLHFLLTEGNKETLERNAREMADSISTSLKNRSVVAWTVQNCGVGCWGDDATVSYGVLLPKFQEILRALASAHPGSVLIV